MDSINTHEVLVLPEPLQKHVFLFLDVYDHDVIRRECHETLEGPRHEACLHLKDRTMRTDGLAETHCREGLVL